jgi:hypothetical protein
MTGGADIRGRVGRVERNGEGSDQFAMFDGAECAP